MPCDLNGTHAECSRVLTNVAMSVYDAYGRLESPTQNQLFAYSTVNRLVREWDECAAESTVQRLGDDIVCVGIVNRLADAALFIDPTLDD